MFLNLLRTTHKELRYNKQTLWCDSKLEKNQNVRLIKDHPKNFNIVKLFSLIWLQMPDTKQNRLFIFSAKRYPISRTNGNHQVHLQLTYFLLLNRGLLAIGISPSTTRPLYIVFEEVRNYCNLLFMQAWLISKQLNWDTGNTPKNTTIFVDF